VTRLRRVLVVGSVVAAGGTLLGRLLGYRLGFHTVVRCRRGHLFETIWIPGVKLKAVELGLVRIQHCPVGKHWSLVVPVKAASLSDADRQLAASYRDVRLP
jgi:hypothetical protein